MQKSFLVKYALLAAASVSIAACGGQAEPQSDTAEAEATTTMAERGPFDNDPLLFDSPVGVWESKLPDGSSYITRHDPDFKTRSEDGEVIGEWTVQGGLTCMRRVSSPDKLTCYIVTADDTQTCPALLPSPGVEDIECTIASPTNPDGSRTLVTSDGKTRTVRRIEG